MSTSSIAFVDPAKTAEALSTAIAAAKQGDPMAPVLVLVPSHAAGRSMGHRLARSGGVANVRFLTLERLAEALLAGRSIERPKRLSGDVRRELVRIVASRAQHPLSSDASPALVQTLLRAFSLLRDRTDTEIDALEGDSELAGELVRLYRAYSERASSFADERTLVEAAERTVDESASAVVVLAYEPPAGHEALLIERLRRLGQLSVIAVLSGDDERDRDVAIWTGSLADAPTTEMPVAQRIVVAPDADIEVRLAVSELLTRAEAGIPFPRMALLFAARSPYALLAHDYLTAAGIPWSGQAPLSLSHTVMGRFVLSLASTVDQRFSRRSVLDWLGSAPLVDPHSGKEVPAARWRAIATSARVGVGPHSWSERLDAYAAVLEAEIDDEHRDTEKRREADDARALGRFMEDFVSWAEPGRHRWNEWASWAQEGINRYVGAQADREKWPQDEAAAACDVERVLQRMSRLDELRSPVSVEVFLAALSDELRTTAGRSSARDGTFVGTFAEAVGCDFDFIVGCGLAEGVLPGPSESHGVLAALQAPAVERRIDHERRAFLLGLASGAERLLSMPRADQRSQREARPSRWLLEQAASLAGRTVNADELIEGHEAWDWLQVVSSFTQALDLPVIQPTGQLEALAALAEGRSAADVADADLVRAHEVIRSRDSSSATEYDGMLGAQPALALSPETPLSPSRLEDWAVCSFRYFLKTVLRVGEQVEDDDPFGMAAMDKGKLVHAALERFIKTVPRRTSPAQPWSEDERRQLLAISEELYEAVHRSGRTPAGLLRDSELSSLREALLSVLDEDELMRAKDQVVPDAGGVEVSFGEKGSDPVLVERPGAAPVTFRGRIDRLDRALDGSKAIAFDYKSGSPKPEFDLTKDSVAKGTKLQLAVYSMRAEQLLGEGIDIQSSYWFTGTSGNQRPYVMKWDDEAKERAKQVVTHMAAGIEGGVFPLVPGPEDRNSFKNCYYCPYDDICPSDRAEAWERKRTDAAVAPFVSLQEGQA